MPPLALAIVALVLMFIAFYAGRIYEVVTHRPRVRFRIQESPLVWRVTTSTKPLVVLVATACIYIFTGSLYAEAATYDIRCDKIHLMATDTLPAAIVQEDSVCRGRYDRGQHAHGNVSKIEWHLTTDHGADIAALLMPDTSQFKSRCRVDGAPVTAWRPWPIAPCDFTQPALADPAKTILQTLPDGSHGADLDIDFPGHHVRVSGVLFTSGPPRGNDVAQALAVCPTALDYAFGAVFSSGCATVEYPNPDLDIEPWNRVSKAVPYSVLPGTGMDRVPQNNARLAAYWVENIGTWGHQQILRNPVCSSANRDGKAGPCRMHTANIQDYAFEDALGTTIVDGTGTSNYMTAMIDGPRGVATLPKVIDAHWCAGNLYTGSAMGRVAWLQASGPNTGRVITVAGYRQRPGHPYGYWREFQSPQFNSHVEFHGAWAPGHTGPTTFNELWGIVLLDYQGMCATAKAHPFVLVMDSKNNRLVVADHAPAHEPGGQPLLKAVVKFDDPAVCRWPWTGALRPGTTWTYVACMMSHTIIRTRPKVANDVWGEWETELVWQSAKRPTREQVGVTDTACRGCPHRATGMTSTQIRAAFHVDGPPGVSSQVFPQALRFDSTGKIIVASRYGFALFEHTLDPDVTKPAVLASKSFAAWFSLPEPGAPDVRDVTIDVNHHGGAGQLDMVRVAGWGPAFPRAFTRQGAYLGGLWPDAPVRTLTTGQMSGAFQLQYPWLFITNKNGEEVVFASGDPTYGIIRRLKLPSDVPVDVAKYNHGHNLWKGGGGGPSYTLTHGQFGIAPLAPMTVDTLGRMQDAAICAEYRTGLGTGILRTLSDADCPSLVYWVRNTAKSTVDATPPPSPVPPPIVIPPVVIPPPPPAPVKPRVRMTVPAGVELEVNGQLVP